MSNPKELPKDYSCDLNLSMQEAALLARKYFLYIRGWSLYHKLWFATYGQASNVLLVRHLNRPIAVGLVTKEAKGRTPRVHVFVEPEHRRMGIASFLLQRFLAEFPKLEANEGTEGSAQLYAKYNIPVTWTWDNRHL